ncbi:Fe(3+)-hydroxamate ABC transporter permease FhuB [Pseudomonas gingeri]|uniref:Fe(3+)-hydroxamate ABC transporter permease FhuB n=1 Tax=Pseudomonas gingeri TaxID=117681 RepID=UPI00210B8587|nr:Fe(3+)-hydroxamate ABC transporter permease FhuB [Pseudomonas gingeri]
MSSFRLPFAPRGGLLLVVGLFALAAVLALFQVSATLEGSSWLSALLAPDRDDVRQVLVHESLLPRVAMALLCGAALGLAGTLVQQVLRNPLAEPMTLGIFPGAYLALAFYTIYVPSGLPGGRELVALGGGALAVLAVLMLAWPQKLSPMAVILSGMVVNLYCGAVSLAMALIHYDLLLGLQIWGGGSLEQAGWQPSGHLAAGLAACVLAVWLVRRPLVLLDSGESTARSLGAKVERTRLIALLVAVVLTALVVAQVGVIGFLGLAAPALARLLGARTLYQRLWWSTCIGAAMLSATDQVVLVLSNTASFSAHLIPTGTVTSLLGVPLLIAMLPRLRKGLVSHWKANWPSSAGFTASRGWGLAVLLFLGLLLSFMVSRGLDGWRVATAAQVSALLFWQLPHTVIAATAGGLLALAGTLLQRATANPMASPDLLGVSSGGALGIVVVVFAVSQPSPIVLFGACLAGSLAALGGLLWLGRGAFNPQRLLLVGVAVSAWFQAMVSATLASGDPRAALMLQLVTGSIYYIPAALAWLSAGVMVLGLCLAPLFTRWLEAFSLGEGAAASVGVPVARARLLILLFAGVLTTVATLLVGPLSFVGLLAPHIARFAGARQPLQQLRVASAFGAVLMVVSEWLGRQWVFPEQMPAGLVATLLGGPYLVLLMLYRRKS